MSKSYFSFIAVSFLCVQVLCAEESASEKIVYKKTVSGISFRVLHREGDKCFEDLFHKKAGDWQELISSNPVECSKLKQRTGEHLSSGWGESLDSELQKILYSEATATRSIALWNSEEEWTWEWELKFSEWIAKDFDQDFLLRHELPTDCADLVYTARFIFARIHKLAIGFTLGGTSQLFTHDSVPSSLAQYTPHEDWTLDRRFRKALDYLHNTTYTHTLFGDSYSIEVSKESLIPGSYILTLSGQSGHTRMLKNVAQTSDEIAAAPMTYYWSNVPRIVRKLYVSGFWDSERYRVGKEGFLRLKGISRTNSKWRFKNAEEMPSYSLMQYSDEFMEQRKMFFAAVFDRLFERVEWDKVLEKIFSDIKESLAQRKAIVEEGFEVCQKENCDPGTENYENFSTPSRDRRLGELMGIARQVRNAFQSDFPTISQIWESHMTTPLVFVEDYPLHFEPINEWMVFWIMSTDPRVSIAKRWGLSELAPLAASTSCVSEERGVNAKYYVLQEENYGLPDFSVLSSYAADLWSKISADWGDNEVAGSGRKDNVAILLDSYIFVPEDTVLDFQLIHDDAVELSLNEQNLFQQHYVGYSYVLQKVRAGFHALKMGYAENTGGAQLKLHWRNSQGRYVVVPEESFYKACDF